MPDLKLKPPPQFASAVSMVRQEVHMTLGDLRKLIAGLPDDTRLLHLDDDQSILFDLAVDQEFVKPNTKPKQDREWGEGHYLRVESIKEGNRALIFSIGEHA